MTLAFSIKSNMWTTEYSFEPHCYAETDGRMLAFKSIANAGALAGRKVWMHDETQDRNLFYDTGYPSKISVVSNEDPSATKAYEAVSLETLYNDWSMQVETHEQSGGTDVFVEKENDQYAEVPKDIKITAANLTYVGTALGSSLIMNSSTESIKMKSLSGKMPIGTLCFRNKSESTQGVGSNAGDGAIVAIDSQTSGRVFNILGTASEDQEAFVKAVDMSQGRLLISNTPTTSAGGPIQEQKYFNNTTEVEIWVASPDSGESFKGDYLVVDLETPATPDNFELYAINVDQHKVNLDHRLGQNN